MQPAFLYSFRIKIVSLRLPHSQPLALRCTLDNRTLSEKHIEMQDGLLVENTTLAFDLEDADLPRTKPVVLRFSEREKSSTEIGSVSLSMRDFENAKIRRIPICTQQSKSDSYLEVFLLMLQSRTEAQPSILASTVRLSHLHALQSSIHIEMDNSSCLSCCVEPESPKSFNASPTLKKIQSQEAETQTYNIESLLTLNSILEEANANLEKEKEELQRRVRKLEATLESQETRRHIDNQYKLRIEEMHDEAERLKESLRQAESKLQEAELRIQQKLIDLAESQQETKRKEALIDELRQRNLRLEEQMALMQEKQTQAVRELNIDEMMLELGKYSEAARKYKNNGSKDTARLTFGSNIENRSVKDFLKVSQKNHSRRSSPNSKVSKFLSNEQTLDSMTESKVFF